MQKLIKWYEKLGHHVAFLTTESTENTERLVKWELCFERKLSQIERKLSRIINAWSENDTFSQISLVIMKKAAIFAVLK